MKSRLSLVALLAALTLVAAACGDSSGDTTTAAPATTQATTTTAAPTTTTTAAPETTTTVPEGDTTTTTEPPLVRANADLVIWADDTRVDVFRTFGEQFAADNGITVAVQELGLDDIRDRTIIAGPAGEGPDILIAVHDQLGQLVSAGVVAPLDISSVEADFNEAAVAAFNYQGQNYGLPYAVENIALIRNTDMVPDAPATFEDLVTVAQGLVADGTAEIPLALQENGNGDPYHNYPIVTALGGYVFGRNADGSYNPDDLGIDTPGGLAAAEYFSELSAEGVVNIDIDYNIMTESFGTGKAPFAITGPWALENFADINYVVEPIPPVAGGTARPFIGVQGMLVSAFAENPLFAQTFILDFMATEDAQYALYEAGNRPPAQNAAFERASSDPVIAGFGLSGAEGYAMPAIPEMSSVWQAWTDAYQLIFEGGDPDEAFMNAAEQIRNLIAS